MKKRPAFAHVPLALAASALLWPVAHAQTAATGLTLPEVRVTSEGGGFSSNKVQVGAFRDLDPLEVPLTNNVVTREVLDAQGARTLFDALRNTAGVMRSQLSGSTYDNISIRGILVENRGNYRLNGSLPVINLIDIPLENKERVEVLKGASSLYYGLVPPSGVVNFVTKRAGATPVTSLATSVNNHGGADAHVDIGRRFAGGDMGLRVNAAAGKQDIGIDNYSGDRSLLAAAYDWRVSPGFSLKADLEHYRKDVSEQAAIALPRAVNGTITLPGVPDNKRNHAGEWQRYDAEATNALLRGDLALGEAWSLTLETGHAETKRDRRFSQLRNYDLTTGEGQLDISFVNGQRFTNTNHRVELMGQLGSGGVRHELTLGYTSNRRDAYLGESTANVLVPQNLYDPRPVPELNPAPLPTTDSTIRDKGLYAFDRLSFGERWQLVAGLRSSDYSNRNTGAQYSAKDVSPNVSVLFKPAPDTSVYASYLEGLEETGTAPANRANAGDILPPAVNKQKELGIKTRAWAKVFAQAALFQIDRPLVTVDPANRQIVGGKSRYRGLEFSASGDITPQWGVVASMQWLDAKIRAVGATNPGELGKTPENTPRHTASLFGEYRLPQVPGLSLNAGVFHVGKRAVNNLNQAWIGSYTTLSLGARYRTRMMGQNVTLQANLDNASDRDYWATAGNSLLGTGAPRTLRVGARVDF